MGDLRIYKREASRRARVRRWADELDLARTLTEARARRGEILAKRTRASGRSRPRRSRPPRPSRRTSRRRGGRRHGSAVPYVGRSTASTSAAPSSTPISGPAALYRHDLSRRELRSLLRRKVASITTDDVARLGRELEPPGANMTTGGVLAGSTIDNVLIALSAVFTLGVRRGWAQTNPVGGLTKAERPKSGKRPHRILSPDEIRRSVEAAGARWRVLVMTAVFSGLRQSELLGLSWRDVDLDAGRLSVRWQLERGTGLLKEPTTTNGVRPVPLPAFVVRALREHKLASRWSLPEHRVFVSDVGGRLDHRNVGRMWERVRVKAGLAEPLPVFHDLRHRRCVVDRRGPRRRLCVAGAGAWVAVDHVGRVRRSVQPGAARGAGDGCVGRGVRRPVGGRSAVVLPGVLAAGVR